MKSCESARNEREPVAEWNHRSSAVAAGSPNAARGGGVPMGGDMGGATPAALGEVLSLFSTSAIVSGSL